MSQSHISQLHIFLEACVLVVLSSLILTLIDGEEWPVIIDPFPDSDEIGTEPPVTPAPPPDCSAVCQEKVDEAMALITSLQQQLNDANSSLFAKISVLESTSNDDLPLRVTALEHYLPMNVSDLQHKIDADVGQLRHQLTSDISKLRRELELQINGIPSNGGGGGGDGAAKANEVYVNVTRRIDLLESGTIQSLVYDNSLWRQNFRVINATFSKLKKSSSSNKVILTG